VRNNSQKGYRKLAKLAQKTYTPAEKRMEDLLNEHPSRKFVGKFHREWVMTPKWRLDFYLWESRVGIEVDGEYHDTEEQFNKDKKKSAAAARNSIKLLRYRNREVLEYGEEVMEEVLLEHDAAKKRLRLAPKKR
jgi:very-short-patch-repair endonuclease